MLSFCIWFSAPSFWIGSGLESRCVSRVYGADAAVRRHHPHHKHDLRSETCRATNTSIEFLVASSWHFTLFHEEDARSNNSP